MREIKGFECRGKYKRSKLQAYSDKMSRADKTHLWNDTVAHILQEQGFEIKESPRSIYDPEQLWTALERYSPEFNTFVDQDDPHIKAGISAAWKIFAKPKHLEKLKALRTNNELQTALKMEKFSGLPNMTKKSEDFIYAVDREQQVIKGRKSPSPCLAGKRTQKNNKTRLVWMYPLEMTIMEARFARPLIDTYLERRTTMAFGMSKFTVGGLIDSICFRDNSKKPVALDYSKYDSSIPSYLIKQAFKIIGTWFTQEEKDEFGFKIVENYFINTPIVMIDGNLYTGKKHGVPSGSYFTQMIDSIVNTMLIMAMSSELKLGIDWRNFLVLGDDVILALEQPDVKAMATFLARYGITLNQEKTAFEAHFLGADWKYGKPHRNFGEILSSATQPETFKKMGNTPSERYKNAIALLVNLAATYSNAWLLLDKRFHSPKSLNYYELEVDPKFMTGFAKFEFEEQKSRFVDKSVDRTTLVARFLK